MNGPADDGGCDCQLVFVARVGHFMNLELPAPYAGYVGGWYGGLAK